MDRIPATESRKTFPSGPYLNLIKNKAPQTTTTDTVLTALGSFVFDYLLTSSGHIHARSVQEKLLRPFKFEYTKVSRRQEQIFMLNNSD